MSDGPRILTLDIERFPNIVHKWSLFDKAPTPISMVERFGSTVSFAAKWYGKPRVEFYSDYHNGHYRMVEQAHRLLNEADIVVTYNGDSFDLPHLRREMVTQNLGPHAPVLSVDLYKVVKKHYRFESNKLQHVSQELGVGSKTQHDGHALWRRCMQALDRINDGVDSTPEDVRAWSLMARYNRQDVRLTEQLYDRLKSWIHNHPHVGLWTGEDHVCGNCGSDQLQRRGFKATAISTYQQYQCQACGAWSRGKTAIARVDERGTA